MYCVYPACFTARIDSYSWTSLPSDDLSALLRNHSTSRFVTQHLARLFLFAQTQNAHIYRSTEPHYLPPSNAAHPVTPVVSQPNRSGAPRLFSTVNSMQARPRPSLDTNVSQYASHPLQPHSVDSGPSSSTAPCDSATSTLVDPFASFSDDSRTADSASPVQEQASPALRSRSHSAASHGSAISKNGILYQEYYIAKYDYEPESSNYLPFSAGQLIKIIRKHSSGWWDGELAGRRGWFPSNYLYSDSSRLVRVRSNSLESVRPFLRSDPVIPTLPLSPKPFYALLLIPSPCIAYSTRLLVLTFLS